MTLEIGSRIDEKYEIVRRLDQGGRFEVWLVRHVHLDALRVIKILRGDRAREASEVRRFGREARIATRIDHPQVATLHDYSVLPDNSLYMVWEYIEGETVGAWMERHGRLPLVPSLSLGLQCLRGLEALHDVGIVHRDVCPQNLIITEDDKHQAWLKIIDLGLARTAAADDSLPGFTGGKVFYCSPEQAHAVEGDVDHRSDLYSFSLVLFEMVAGALPFARSLAGGLAARYERPPATLSSVVVDETIPEGLDAWFERSLSLRPEGRFQSASEAASALQRVVEGFRRRVDEVEVPSDARHDPASLVGLAERALLDGDLDGAMRTLDVLERLDPPPLGLSELRRRLEETFQRRSRMQIMQTEELLNQHLRDRKKGLARMALDLLLELDPDHSAREGLIERVESLDLEIEAMSEAERALHEGRKRALMGDLDGAREQLERLESIDAPTSFVTRLEEEIARAEQKKAKSYGVGKLKEKIEQHLDSGRADAAEKEVDQLVSMTDLPKAVVDVYRGRIEELRRRTRDQWEARMIELRFPRLLAENDFAAAREAAIALERLFPDSDRPSAMFTEVSRRESEALHRQAIEDGIATVQLFLEDDRLEEAEIALRAFVRMAPEHAARWRLESMLARRQAGLSAEIEAPMDAPAEIPLESREEPRVDSLPEPRELVLGDEDDGEEDAGQDGDDSLGESDVVEEDDDTLPMRAPDELAAEPEPTERDRTRGDEP